MKAEFENTPLVKNEEKRRFQIELNSHFAFIDYKENSHQIALIHTEAEPELAGTGAAAAVVKKTLTYIEESGKNYFPTALMFSHLSKKIQTGNESLMKGSTVTINFNFT